MKTILNFNIMQHLTINQTLRNVQGKHRLIFGDKESIKVRDAVGKKYKKFKKSGLSEAQFYFREELRWWGC